jgi:hypothetical protein
MFSLLPNQTNISLFYIGTLDGRCHCSGVGRKRARSHKWRKRKKGSGEKEGSCKQPGKLQGVEVQKQISGEQRGLWYSYGQERVP